MFFGDTAGSFNPSSAAPFDDVSRRNVFSFSCFQEAGSQDLGAKLLKVLFFALDELFHSLVEFFTQIRWHLSLNAASGIKDGIPEESESTRRSLQRQPQELDRYQQLLEGIHARCVLHNRFRVEPINAKIALPLR
jgi:hypothetical protein